MKAVGYNAECSTVQNELHGAWANVRTAFGRMNKTVQVRPDQATEIFKMDVTDEDRPVVHVGPVVARMPERANHVENDLFVVLRGRIVFGAKVGNQRSTVHFGTEVGYFRVDGEVLTHVYGVHFDMDETYAHPLFHAQLSSMMDMTDQIEDKFRLGLKVEDKAHGLLKNVRVPTAQMDAFSVLMQLAADHLTNEGSPIENRTAFKELREACSFLSGAASSYPALSVGEAPSCYRSKHWYAWEMAAAET